MVWPDRNGHQVYNILVVVSHHSYALYAAMEEIVKFRLEMPDVDWISIDSTLDCMAVVEHDCLDSMQYTSLDY